ncbi:MAG: MASE1 domain-containing protein [Gammaproteobacteria bacterium]|nr:MASE1 domain-containing protein [Gammaproteobacteria bacterium]
MTALLHRVPSGPVLFLLTGLAYLALAQYVVFLNDPVHLGAGFWPAAGVTLAALLLLPYERWPWVIAAIAAAEIGGDLAHGYPVAATLWWAAGNCIEPLIGATLIRRYGDLRGMLVPPRNLLVFIAFGVVIAPLIGASIGTLGSVTSIGNPFWQVWPKYVVGDALGVLVIAPVLLAWSAPRTRRSIPEILLLLASLTLVSVLAFRNWPAEWDVVLPYLIVPVLTWGALRFGIQGAAWSVLLTANVANLATAIGYGPFAIAGEPSGHAITLLQIFLGITASTALILAAFVDDLTDRRAAEAAMRAREAELRRQARLLDEARDAIIELDMDQRVRFWNRGAERLYGWSREEALHRTIEECCATDGDEIRAAFVEVTMRDEWTGQLEQRRRDGERLTVEGHWTLVRDGAGNPESVLAIHTDITRRLALEAQLRQSQRLEAIGQLTGGVAHDFNNLLMVIIGNAEMLADELRDHPQHHPMAETIHVAAQRGADLVRQMLAFARRQALVPQPTDIGHQIDAMESLLRRTLTENIVIEHVRDPDAGPALVDPVQLESALMNLALNARNAMPDGGRLRIETARARLEPGHPDHDPALTPAPMWSSPSPTPVAASLPSTSTAVFDPFFTTRQSSSGSGLGLSMVYGFIKQSGGHVAISSTLGEGTRIRLYLPRAPVEASLPSDSGRPEPLPTGSERILVVEDDEAVRRHVSHQLARLGYRVLIASDASEALELLEGTCRHRSAVHRHHHARRAERLPTGRGSAGTAAGTAGAVHFRLQPRRPGRSGEHR